MKSKKSAKSQKSSEKNKKRGSFYSSKGQESQSPKKSFERGSGKFGGTTASAPKTTEKKIFVGIVKRHPDGFGFLIPEDRTQPDVYIPKHSMTGVMTNDKVEAEIFPSRKGDKFFGEILRIVHRNTKVVTGRLTFLNEREAVLFDEGKVWGANLKIFREFTMGGKEGDYVAAEITAYPTARGDFSGRVTKLIGDADQAVNDTKRVIAMAQIPEGFSRRAIQEAEDWGPVVKESDIAKRKDLRHLPFVTIDGATAKDFDDAIFVEQTDKGFHAYVAIADVSHYVELGSTLDQEAYEKGNSTYFPGYVVPMLPEHLSNGLCSLNPNVDRLALIADMHLDFQGQMLHAVFYEAVIKSQARVTYGEAQEIVDDKVPENLVNVAVHIKRAADLSKILMAKRFKEGSLDLDIPSTEVILDSNGEPIDIIRSERLFSHRLIEELMLLANVAVAKFLSEKNIPSIYRVHDVPRPDDIEQLQRFLAIFGSGRSVQGDTNLAKKLTKALQEFEGRPESQILNILALRSMSQAKYSPENIGHFGLGFTFYTHFTSPIRRYADLVVHRLLKSQIMRGYEQCALSLDDLAGIGTMTSACEQRSVKAERQLVSIKKARFMQKFLGQEFEGVISSVAKFGVFVLLRQFDVDGLVKVENLGGDRFEFDDQNLMLFSKSGKQFAIGDVVKVQVSNVNIEEGQVDFVLVKNEGEEQSESDNRPRPDRQDDQKRRTPKEDRGHLREVRLSRRGRKDKSK